MNRNIFSTVDALNNPVTLTWQEIPGGSEQLTEKIRSIAPILIESYAQTEVEFARNRPQEVAADFMLKSLAPLLENETNAIDWNLFHQKTAAHLEQFFATTDWGKYSNSEDQNIFVTIYDQNTGTALGVLQFLIMPAFEQGTESGALWRYSIGT